MAAIELSYRVENFAKKWEINKSRWFTYISICPLFQYVTFHPKVHQLNLDKAGIKEKLRTFFDLISSEELS